ncbi:hypothetical protein ACQPW1_16605 [Nocardia sp. CA-128927]|uniref:hypothetical protein n=1 Tax=Nocardia sp. CA-128927 TaxID=3239975 RepID=UPI003D98C94A
MLSSIEMPYAALASACLRTNVRRSAHIDAMSETRTGREDIFVPLRLANDRNAIRALITKAMENRLAKTDEWPVEIDDRSAGVAVRDDPTVMKYSVGFGTGPFGDRVWL